MGPTTTMFIGSAPPGSPVDLHGHLSIQETSPTTKRIVDKNGEVVRLRGMSFFWSQWMGAFYNADVVQWLAADWNVQLLRVALGVNSNDGLGYLDNPEVERTKIETVVEAAIELGIYVIIDWHTH